MLKTVFSGNYSDFVRHEKRHFSFRKFAFTLSEVLITLVIIGVIAAITLPVLYADYQKQAIKSALKKNYSVLKQALDRYQADNGGERIVASDISLDKNPFYEVLRPYLNIMYDCGETRLNSLCVPMEGHDSDNSLNSDRYKTYNGITINYNLFDDGQFVLNDGSLLLFEGYDSTQENTVQYVSVDVNGYGKKPNRLGRDLFMFQLTDEGELLPMGAKGTTYSDCSNTSKSTLNGAGCTYKVLMD